MIFLGHSTVDEIHIGTEISYIPGGGVYYGALSAASCLRNVSDQEVSLEVLTIGFEKDLLNAKHEYSSLNVQFSLINDTKTTTFIHSFKDNDPDKRISHVPHISRSFNFEDIQNLFTDVLYVNPLFYGEIPDQLFPELKKKCNVLSLDAQGLLRNISSDGQLFLKAPQSLDEILKNLTIFKIDVEEGRALSGLQDIDDFCRYFIDKGVKYTICTSQDNVYIFTSKEKFVSKFTQWTLKGRTGRGDTVSASFILMHFVLKKGIQESLDIAAAGTSRKMMHAGPATIEDFRMTSKL
jgi:sugar/nucleoside kinase (ribokinase family)